MSYVTLEVELDHGRVVAKDAVALPDKATGLLTILRPAPVEPHSVSVLEALEALQNHLGIKEETALQWSATVRDGRR